MGGTWTYTGTEWRKLKRPFGGTTTGFVNVNRIFRQVGADGDDDWLEFWERPSTPPNAPTIAVGIHKKTRNAFDVTVTMPPALVDGDISRVVVKVGIGTVPNPPTVNDNAYYTQKDGSEPWSEWFTKYVGPNEFIPPNTTGSKVFPNGFMSNVVVPLNTDVTFTAWAMDEFGNWSAGASQTIRSLKSTDPLAGGVTYTTAIMPSGFDEYAHASDLWMFSTINVGGKPAYAEPTWFRSSTNPNWWVNQGGSSKRQAYLFFGNSLRAVMNSAAEVKSVKMSLLRRYDTAANLSGGKHVNDADLFGPKAGVKLHVWAASTATKANAPRGSTSHLISGSDSIIEMGTWGTNTAKTIVIPKKTWENFLDGKNGAGRSLCFYNSTSSGSSTDVYSASFAVPGVFNSSAKYVKPSMSGYLIVEWVGYDGNPWPNATPGSPSFRPINAPSTW